MSVLPGEGPHLILYGSTTFAVRTRTYGGYLARPDSAGAHPVAIVLGEIGPGIKELCRQLARHGLAAVALSSGDGDLSDLMKWISAPGTPWADAGRVGAIITTSSTIDPVAADGVRSLVFLDAAPTTVGRRALGLYGADGTAAADARGVDVPGSQWVLYADATDGFWDLGGDEYRPDAAADAVARIVGFFDETLRAPEAA